MGHIHTAYRNQMDVLARHRWLLLAALGGREGVPVVDMCMVGAGVVQATYIRGHLADWGRRLEDWTLRTGD